MPHLLIGRLYRDQPGTAGSNLDLKTSPESRSFRPVRTTGACTLFSCIPSRASSFVRETWLRRQDGARGGDGSKTRSVMRHGQPQSRKRDTSAHRSPARRSKARRISCPASKSQRRCRRSLARPGGLGTHARHDCAHSGLGFLPLRDERYDFVVPKSRANRAGVAAFKKLPNEPSTREALARLRMKV